ncbi:transcriptional regulator [Candidatus Peregrinibacteria bacterium]|nr:transcriptional regulator [Candidatus Peregrinibacteria bacterium]
MWRKKTTEEKYARELFEIIQKISSDKKLLKDFFIDLLTPHEYQEIIKRWQIVKQLTKGIPQRKIAKNLKVGIATITRGSRELSDKDGGFNKVLKG